jgi:hypothetical protein
MEQPQGQSNSRRSTFTFVSLHQSERGIVLEQGIPGSEMPAWKGRLNDDERKLLCGTCKACMTASKRRW